MDQVYETRRTLIAIRWTRLFFEGDLVFEQRFNGSDGSVSPNDAFEISSRVSAHITGSLRPVRDGTRESGGTFCGHMSGRAGKRLYVHDVLVGSRCEFRQRLTLAIIPLTGTWDTHGGQTSRPYGGKSGTAFGPVNCPFSVRSYIIFYLAR
jgi:hypothetical protein